LHPTRTIEIVEERNWFFRLSKYRDALLAHFAAHPSFLEPESRRNEILRVLEGGLEDVSASRARFTWGVPFPRPLSTGETQTTYVWFDALPNYWTVTRAPNARAEWPAQLHVVGKDITRFHAIIWPAMLMAAGEPLPDRVWAHGFISLGGERFSKSAGVKLELGEAIGRYGVDPFRYYLLRDVPFDGDGNFSWERFAEVYESELANTLGNLASRTTAMVEKYFGGVVPDGDAKPAATGLAAPERIMIAVNRVIPVLHASDTALPAAEQRSYRFHELIAEIMAALRESNEFIQRTQPWSLAKDPAKRDELASVMTALVRTLAYASLGLAPVIPEKTQNLWTSIGGPGRIDEQRWSTHPGLSVAGWRVSKSAPLFPKTDNAESAT
jgi:methionyl-tRNA synthetase